MPLKPGLAVVRFPFGASMPFLRTLLGREGDRVMLATDVYKLLDGTAEAAFVVTVESEICFWNAAAERLFGYTRQRTF